MAETAPLTGWIKNDDKPRLPPSRTKNVAAEPVPPPPGIKTKKM